MYLLTRSAHREYARDSSFQNKAKNGIFLPLQVVRRYLEHMRNELVRTLIHWLAVSLTNYTHDFMTSAKLMHSSEEWSFYPYKILEDLHTFLKAASFCTRDIMSYLKEEHSSKQVCHLLSFEFWNSAFHILAGWNLDRHCLMFGLLMQARSNLKKYINNGK